MLLHRGAKAFEASPAGIGLLIAGDVADADRLLDVFELLVSGRMRGVAGSEITVDEGFTAGWRTARSVR